MASLNMYFLDVGQGDGTFIVLPDNQTLLIDLGSNKNSKTAGIDAVDTINNIINDDNLNQSIDYLVLTHGDSDHYNLIEALMAKNITINNVYFGGNADDYGSGENNILLKIQDVNSNAKFKSFLNGSNVTPNNKTKLTIGDFEISVLAANNYKNNKNQNSIVLRFDYGGNSVILSGDADTYVEDLIMNEADAADLMSTILKLGHHGSNTSNSQDWLNTVNPSFVFVSCDNHDSYNHPDIRVIDRVLQTTNINNQNSSENHGWVIGNNASKGIDVTSEDFETSYPNISIDYSDINCQYAGFSSQDAIFSSIYKLESNDTGYTAYGTCYLCQLGDDGSLIISYLDVSTSNTVTVYNENPNA